MKKADADQRQHFTELYLRIPPEGISKEFPDEAACRARLQEVVWPDGPVCPWCGGRDAYPLPEYLKHRCRLCRKFFSLLSASWFRGTHLRLETWFKCIEIFLRAHAKGRADNLLVAQRFADTTGMARGTATTKLAALGTELLKTDGGEPGRLLCYHPLEIPDGIERGGESYRAFLREQLSKRK